MKLRNLFACMLCMSLLFGLCACGSKSNSADLSDTVYVEIDMEDGGYIKLELYHSVAPITVENFVNLCNEHFYDGIIFHRVIYNFVIQGGDPEGTGYGGSAETIKGEFTANGVQNNISHTRGVISMARTSQSMDSASSQFFICHADATSLDGQYAAFGRVIEGMETVDRIASVATDSNDKPLADQVIKTIRVISEEEAKAEGAAPTAETVSAAGTDTAA